MHISAAASRPVIPRLDVAARLRQDAGGGEGGAGLAPESASVIAQRDVNNLKGYRHEPDFDRMTQRQRFKST